MTTREKIKEELKTKTTAEIVALWNEYASEHYPDNYIYSMDEFDDILDGREPWEIARSTFYGDFRPCDDYFYYNGYGNLCSGNYADYNELKHDFITDLPVDFDYLIDELETTNYINFQMAKQ
jgi:hypothetical protein